MKDIATPDPLVHDLGALLDAAAADPARVDTLKAQVRAQLARRPVVVPNTDAVDEADDEDLWNNLPL